MQKVIACASHNPVGDVMSENSYVVIGMVFARPCLKRRNGIKYSLDQKYKNVENSAVHNRNTGLGD